MSFRYQEEWSEVEQLRSEVETLKEQVDKLERIIGDFTPGAFPKDMRTMSEVVWFLYCKGGHYAANKWSCDGDSECD